MFPKSASPPFTCLSYPHSIQYCRCTCFILHFSSLCSFLYCRLLVCSAQRYPGPRETVCNTKLALFLCQYIHLGDSGEEHNTCRDSSCLSQLAKITAPCARVCVCVFFVCVNAFDVAYLNVMEISEVHRDPNFEGLHCLLLMMGDALASITYVYTSSKGVRGPAYSHICMCIG